MHADITTIFEIDHRDWNDAVFASPEDALQFVKSFDPEAKLEYADFVWKLTFTNTSSMTGNPITYEEELWEKDLISYKDKK